MEGFIFEKVLTPLTPNEIIRLVICGSFSPRDPAKTIRASSARGTQNVLSWLGFSRADPERICRSFHAWKANFKRLDYPRNSLLGIATKGNLCQKKPVLSPSVRPLPSFAWEAGYVIAGRMPQDFRHKLP